MNTPRVLFVCIHNSARSQMAEAFLRRYGGARVEVHSAGLEAGTLNPIVVEAMRERGLDISHQVAKSVDTYLRARTEFAVVITVCDEANAERCPHFPGAGRRLHWSFPDPSAFQGTPAQRLERTRQVRDLIEARVQAWCAGELADPLPAP